MPGPVDPIRRPAASRRVAERRRQERRAEERRAAAPAPEPAQPAPAPEPGPKAPSPSPGAFSAQVLGQGGEKRGLRGGPPVLESARSAYLEAEFLGPKDRRTRKGRITRTEI